MFSFVFIFSCLTSIFILIGLVLRLVDSCMVWGPDGLCAIGGGVILVSAWNWSHRLDSRVLDLIGLCLSGIYFFVSLNSRYLGHWPIIIIPYIYSAILS